MLATKSIRMPNTCSAPGCKSNYNPEDRIPVFRMPQQPDELRQSWIRALHREDLDNLKTVFVCVKHFREEDIEYTHKVPNGDGTYRELPRKNPKLKDWTVPAYLPGCPSYYSQSTTKRRRLSFDSKEDEQLQQAVALSLTSQTEEKEKYLIHSFQDLKVKLTCISLPNWSLWFPNEQSLIFMRPHLLNSNILVDVYLKVESDLSIKAFHNGDVIPLSTCSISDTRLLESILSEIYEFSHKPSSSNTSNTSNTECTNATHISMAMEHIQQTIGKIPTSDEFFECPELSRLQFILCQLENSLIPKNRRRYNLITQILALKTHLISPACYKYLQGLPCLSLPHFHTLEKLYHSFGLENEFFSFLKQATKYFSTEQKHVIIQMDEIHIKSDISYKGGKLVGPNLNPDDPTKTVFAIMASSLHKKWSCIVRLLPCASISAEDIFSVLQSCIEDIELCGLLVQVISTDNYPLNVKLFKLFSPVGKLETRVPHPCDINRPLFHTFDFVHILKTIRNNWLNQISAAKLSLILI